MSIATANEFRIEEDALGEVRVPAEHLWGAQTQRSHMNFPIGVERFRWGRPVIRALGILKRCAALANGQLSQILKDRDIAVAVGLQAQKDGVAPKVSEDELRKRVLKTQWTPAYTTLE